MGVAVLMPVWGAGAPAAAAVPTPALVEKAENFGICGATRGAAAVVLPATKVFAALGAFGVALTTFGLMVILAALAVCNGCGTAGVVVVVAVDPERLDGGGGADSRLVVAKEGDG